MDSAFSEMADRMDFLNKWIILFDNGCSSSAGNIEPCNDGQEERASISATDEVMLATADISMFMGINQQFMEMYEGISWQFVGILDF
jgi:hypothetical protein